MEDNDKPWGCPTFRQNHRTNLRIFHLFVDLGAHPVSTFDSRQRPYPRKKIMRIQPTPSSENPSLTGHLLSGWGGVRVFEFVMNLWLQMTDLVGTCTLSMKVTGGKKKWHPTIFPEAIELI